MIARPVVITCYRDAVDFIIAGLHPKSDLLMKRHRAPVDRRSARPDNRAIVLVANLKKVLVERFAQAFFGEIRVDSHEMNIGFILKGRGP